jgi:nucleoside-diphosphate-sugar epimerase
LVLPPLDAVVHLAGKTHSGVGDELLGEYRRINVDGTRRLIAAAREAGASQFVFMSSIKVNGEISPPGRPFTADDAPAPSDPYGITKLEAETAVRDLAERAGIRWTIVRAPLVYGQGVRANFRRLADLAACGVPLPLGGTGNRRSLIHVDNLAGFIAQCLGAAQANDQIFLVSDGEDVSTTDLIHRMAAASGKTARLFRLPRPLLRGVARITGRSAAFDKLFGDLQLDDGKARKMMGWTPAVTLENGLAELMRPPG